MRLDFKLRTTELTDDKIRAQLTELETRYAMPSAVFLARFNRGELGDDLDFIRWAGLLRVAAKIGLWDKVRR